MTIGSLLSALEKTSNEISDLVGRNSQNDLEVEPLKNLGMKLLSLVSDLFAFIQLKD